MLDREISQRMDAYRGNPQALMQRYQQSQQLIDLLALQKLKSEKEAAARSLQMQQAPEGGLPTVAQQREQEVMDMTRQEVAQQVGQTAQRQQQQQQAAIQQLLSGIARAPGAGNAMSPQAMAAGGIVAFDRGGSARLSDEERRRKEEEQMALERIEGKSTPSAEAEPARRPIIENTQVLTEAAQGRAAPGGIANLPTASNAVLSAANTARELFGTGPAQSAATRAADDAYQAQLRAIESYATDVGQRPTMTAEARAARLADIAAAKERMQKEFDPESERLNSLIAALSAMGGRTSIGSMGAAGARAAMSQEAQREAARRERAKEISGMEEAFRQREEAEQLGIYQDRRATTERMLAARNEAAKLASSIAEGRDKLAADLYGRAMQIAGQAGISDAELRTKVGMLAQELGFKGQEGQLNRFVDMLKIASAERVADIQAERTDQGMRGAIIYANEEQEKNPSLSRNAALARGYERYQQNLALGRATSEDRAAEQARKSREALGKDPDYETLTMKYRNTRDPEKRADIERQLRGVYARYGVPFDTVGGAGAPPPPSGFTPVPSRTQRPIGG